MYEGSSVTNTLFFKFLIINSIVIPTETSFWSECVSGVQKISKCFSLYIWNNMLMKDSQATKLCVCKVYPTDFEAIF